MRLLLEQKDNSNNDINNLISEVYSFIKYINDRLSSIDRKLNRIQPKIRQLFSALNKPAFNSKVEKFILFILNNSQLENKTVTFPKNIPPPVLHIPTPNFTIISRDKELFPSKPKERKHYTQNKKVIIENEKRILDKLKDLETIQKWENFILSEIDLRKQINLSQAFFKIVKEENNSQIAVCVIFNLIKHIYNNPQKLQLKTDKSLEINTEFKNITLWKMSVTKLQ